MSKRMTETEKWRDRWFRGLPPDHKLGYLYLLDQCDIAGTIEIDEQLAEFQIGTAPDWAELIASSEGRLKRLESGRIWITKFISYQYGEKFPSESNVHQAVLRVAEKARLPVGLPKGRASKKAQAKDKAKDNTKNIVSAAEEWVLPPGFDTPAVRTALDEFEEYRKTVKRKPIKSRVATSKQFKHFDDAAHLVFAIEHVIANEYQGLKTDYRPPRKPVGRSRIEQNQQGAIDFVEDESI